jgi:hypothetical protein
MSSVVVVTPLIIAGWPVISAAVTAAVGSMGFSIVSGAVANANAGVGTNVRAGEKTKSKAEIEIEDSEILGQAAAGVGGNEIVVERDGVRAVFSRDARGSLKLCMEGYHLSKAELKRLGEELIGRVTQQYAYHRIVTELQQRNMTIVDEEVGADRTVKIRVRNL